MTGQASHSKAQRLRIYINEGDRWRGKPLDSALLEVLRAQGMAGATMFRGMAGFGVHARIHTTTNEVLSNDLPVVIESVDTPERIAAALDRIQPMVREGLITLEDVVMVSHPQRLLTPLPTGRLVREVMTHPVVSILQQSPVHAAWQQMLEHGQKALPVIDDHGRVVGILTNEDLLQRAGLQQRLSIAIRLEKNELEQERNALRSSSLTVADVMSHPVVTALETDTLGAATQRMVKAGLKRLPVLQSDGRLAGMLSRLDILRQVARTPTDQPEEPPLPAHNVSTVKDIMTTDIPVINQDEDLPAMVEKFARCASHRLVVVDAAGQAIGLISDSDLVARVQPARRRNVLEALRQIGKPVPGTETAFDLMSPGPLTAPPDLPVTEAVREMLAQSRKWLVVIDPAGKPLGLVDRRRLLEALVAHPSKEDPA